MYQNALSRFALASALLFAAGACSDGGSSGPDYDDEATTADTEEAADDAADMMTDVAYAVNFGTPNIFLFTSSAAKRFETKHPMFGGRFGAAIRDNGITMPGLSASAGGSLQYSAAVGCSVESSGTDGDPFEPYDGNENGIPDDWHVKLVCVEKDTSDAENTVTFTETVEMSAKENTSALYGYTAKMLYHIKVSDEEGNAEGVEYDASDALDIRAGTASHHFKLNAREFGTTAGETEEAFGGEERSVSFDPDGTIALGDPLPDGEFDFNGRQWYGNTDDVSLSFTIATTDPIVFDAACYDLTDPPFTDGTLVGHLNGNSHSASFQVDFTGCGTYTVSVDNTSDEPVVVTREQPTERRVALRRN